MINIKTLRCAAATRRADRRRRLLVRSCGVVGFALLTAVGANIALPVPGTPVPFTLQTLFVLLAGITLGPRLGCASMVFYVLLGTCGYHVFALGHMGLNTIFGPTGGYLLGFVFAQPLLGLLTQRGRRVWPGLLGALLLGNFVIFAAGLIWLSLWLGTDVGRTLELGFWPFVPGLILKTAAAAGGGRLLLRTVRPRLDCA